MSMSRDRVRFKLDASNADSATRRAFTSAFGQSLPHRPGYSFSPGGKVVIVCRPSQFARFLIFRNANDGKNSFKELEAELFTPCVENQPIDVSTNPRQGD
jgi:hypothetical protein